MADVSVVVGVCFVLLIFLLVEIGGGKRKVSYRFRSDTFVLQEIPVCLIVACVCVCVCAKLSFLFPGRICETFQSEKITSEKVGLQKRWKLGGVCVGIEYYLGNLPRVGKFEKKSS